MRQTARQTKRSDTELVLAARGDDRQAFGELFDRWFNSSWNVARTILRNDEQAADIAQDAMLAAWQGLEQLDDPDAFGGWLLRITRNRALTRLERENRSRATGDDVVSGLRDAGLPDPTGAARLPTPDAASEVRDRQELVWAAAAALGEREASLLDLHLRHGLTPSELAIELGVEANNAHQQLYRLRNKLGDAIGSYLLWRNGRPLCEGLAAAVSGQVAFDRSVAQAVSRHRADCDECSQRRAALVDPGKMFAAAPMIMVPTQLKLNAAAALQSAGVPVGGGQGPGPDSSSGDPSDGGPSDGGPGSGPDGGLDAGQSPDPAHGGSQPGPTEPSQGPVGEQPVGEAAGQVHGLGGEAGGPIGLPSQPLADASTMYGAAAKGGGQASQTSGSIGLFKVALVAAGTAAVAGLAMWSLLPSDTEDGDAVAAGLEEQVAGPGIEPPGGSPAELGQSSADQSGARATLDPSLAPRSDSSATTGTTTGATTTSLTEESSTSATGASTSTDTTETTAQSTTTAQTATTGSTTSTPTTAEQTTTERPSTTPTTEVTTTEVTTSVTVSITRPTVPSTPITPTTPSTPTTPTTGSTTSEVADPPEILRFTTALPSSSLPCNSRIQTTFRVSWATINTDSVTLSLPGGTITGGPDGTHEFCGSAGDRVSLVAVGPGGQDKTSLDL